MQSQNNYNARNQSYKDLNKVFNTSNENKQKIKLKIFLMKIN